MTISPQIPSVQRAANASHAAFFCVIRTAGFLKSLRKVSPSARRVAERELARLDHEGLLPGDRLEKPWGLESYSIFTLRISGDLRLVLTRQAKTLRLFFLGHHDDAYRFAARNRELMAAVS